MAQSPQTAAGKPGLMQQWQSIKPLAIAFAIGLVAGPIATNIGGFQVLSSTAQQRTEMASVAVQARICAAQALIADPKAADLGWSERRELAAHWAVMPGSDTAVDGVASACSNLLAG
ncbi:hypothetical protein [Ferrovibrio sp.]|uniref:hypothetical protein n=1 Tax=Ferrovibrio sp. TaxID=1917215 RepID=UPI00311F60AD